LHTGCRQTLPLAYSRRLAQALAPTVARFQKWCQKLLFSDLLKTRKSVDFWFETQNLNFTDKNWLIVEFDRSIFGQFSIQNSNIE
jgi:hypothetical protein